MEAAKKLSESHKTHIPSYATHQFYTNKSLNLSEPQLFIFERVGIMLIAPFPPPPHLLWESNEIMSVEMLCQPKAVITPRWPIIIKNWFSWFLQLSLPFHLPSWLKIEAQWMYCFGAGN